MNELAKMKQLQAVSSSSSSPAAAVAAGTATGNGGEQSSSGSQMMMMQQQHMVNSGVDPFLGQTVVPGAAAPCSVESHSVHTATTADAGRG